MDNESLGMLQQIQKKNLENIIQLDTVLGSDECARLIGENERLHKLETSERDMRLKESQHKLEADKFKYQQEQDVRNARLQLNRSWIDNAADIFEAAIAGVCDLYLGPSLFSWGVDYDQGHVMASRTLRGFYDKITRAKHR